MKKLTFRLLTLLIITLVLSLNFSWVRASEVLETRTPQPKLSIEAKKLDPKAEILQEYLAKHNSPLQSNAQDFIDAANQYNLDWRLVAAISGTESTFGKFIPGGYNGWGWGVYGTQALYFKSWKDGIYTVSKGLKEDYVSRGLTDPYKMNKRYAASPRWGRNVTFFMNDLEKFASKQQANKLDVHLPIIKIAANSGLIAFD